MVCVLGGGQGEREKLLSFDSYYLPIVSESHAECLCVTCIEFISLSVRKEAGV